MEDQEAIERLGNDAQGIELLLLQSDLGDLISGKAAHDRLLNVAKALLGLLQPPSEQTGAHTSEVQTGAHTSINKLRYKLEHTRDASTADVEPLLQMLRAHSTVLQIVQVLTRYLYLP